METDPLVLAARKNLADVEALSARVDAMAARAPARVAAAPPPSKARPVQRA